MSTAGSVMMAGLGVVGAGLVLAGPLGWWGYATDARAHTAPRTTATAAATPAAPTPLPAQQTWTVEAQDPNAAPSATDPAALPDSGTPGTPGAPTAQAPAAPVDAPRPSKEKVAYLTFDDGPDPAYTPQVLRTLDAYGAKATFFMIGEEAAANPGLVRAVKDAGHAIGNHSYTHPWLSKLPEAKARDEVTHTNTVLGGRISCLRPPGGMEGGPVRTIARDLGMAIQLWTVDTDDWKRPGTPAIVKNALTPPDGGGEEPLEILFHDGGGDRSQTVAALPQVLGRLAAQGYTFETLPTCATS